MPIEFNHTIVWSQEGKRQQGCVASVSGINLAIGTSAKPLVQPPFVRDAPAGGRSGHPDGAGTAGATGT
jgi:hypothetical protein